MSSPTSRTMHVALVSVEEQVWSGNAISVFAKTAEGELGVFRGHQPLLAALVPDSTVRIDRPGADSLSVTLAGGGFLSVRGDGVSVLAETAEIASGTL